YAMSGCSSLLRGRCPSESRSELVGQVADDLPIVVGTEGEGQRDSHFVGTLKARMLEQPISQFVGRADVVGGEQHAARPLRCLGALEAARGVVAISADL